MAGRGERGEQNVQHLPHQHPQLLPGGDSGGPGPGQPGQWGPARRHPPHRPQAPPRLSVRAGASPGGEVRQHREAESEDTLDQSGQQPCHSQHSGQFSFLTKSRLKCFISKLKTNELSPLYSDNLQKHFKTSKSLIMKYSRN